MEIERKIESYIKTLKFPILNKQIFNKKTIKKIECEGDHVRIDLQLGFYAGNIIQEFKNILLEGIKDFTNNEIDINISSKVQSHKVQTGVKTLPNVKNIIAIASGKGGVGKSTATANLALALSAQGANVGILDADIYGPSQPTMFGISQKPRSSDGKTMDPLKAHNIQIMSIGFLVDQETPMVWRGPMVTSTLEQLLRETKWNNLDYLLIDLPPGTGDIQLTLAQKIPVTGAIIVTTPQDIALLDARRGLKMFEKVNVPILGIIENMALHICSKCNNEEHIFGKDGGVKMSKDYNVDLLGSLPLDIKIREDLDGGKPTVVNDNNSPITKIFSEIAIKIASKIADYSEDHTSKFPKIVIEKNT
jgi:ATP-binding protein involved in chromosome partitioning